MKKCKELEESNGNYKKSILSAESHCKDVDFSYKCLLETKTGLEKSLGKMMKQNDDAHGEIQELKTALQRTVLQTNNIQILNMHQENTIAKVSIITNCKAH